MTGLIACVAASNWSALFGSAGAIAGVVAGSSAFEAIGTVARSFAKGLLGVVASLLLLLWWGTLLLDGDWWSSWWWESVRLGLTTYNLGPCGGTGGLLDG